MLKQVTHDCAGKQRPPLKWFVKVAASGALGLQELLHLPARS
jgi:hypothetical protein